jgi:hypothetical protein
LKTTQQSDTQGQFQIGLQKINTEDEDCSTYKMSLRIDPVLWFKHHALNNSDVQNLEQLYEIGSRYVRKVKNEAEHYPTLKIENEIKRIPMDNSAYKSWCKSERQGVPCISQIGSRQSCQLDHYTWCEAENCSTGECKPIPAFANDHNKNFLHTLNIDKYEKPVYYQCRSLITKLDRQRVLCNFVVDPNFRIYQDKVEKSTSYPYFIVGARKNAIPVITLNPVKHCLNEEYIRTSDAWQAVLQTLRYMTNNLKLDKLPLNRIYVNFRKWMTQEADDSMRRNCHAHINIVLTRQTIEKINKLYESNDKRINVKKLFPSLVGSVLPPKTHRLDDSLKLIEYMNNHMTPLLIKKNRKLERTISSLKEELETLKSENKNLRQMVFGPTYDGQEVDDSMNGTDADDNGTGINDQVVLEEVY